MKSLSNCLVHLKNWIIFVQFVRSLYTHIYRYRYMFWYKSFIRYTINKYFLAVCGLSFHFLNGACWKAKVLNFDAVKFIGIFFYRSCFYDFSCLKISCFKIETIIVWESNWVSLPRVNNSYQIPMCPLVVFYVCISKFRYILFPPYDSVFKNFLDQCSLTFSITCPLKKVINQMKLIKFNFSLRNEYSA